MTAMLSFKQTLRTIKTAGTKTSVMVRGAMGIGKSSLGKALAADLGSEYALVTFDCAVRSEGDLALPWVSEVKVGDQVHRVTSFAPTELLGLHLGKKLIINFDELSKAPDSVINMVLPVILERRVNATPLPEGSIVFCTGNLASELVGDRIPAHAYNRMMVVQMRKPLLTDSFGNPGEWFADYADAAGVHPVAKAFALEYPQIFAEYSRETEGNPYIHKPGKVMDQFVTPRSFADVACHIMHKQDEFGDKFVFHAALEGLIGKAAATDLITFIDTDADLPRTADIVQDPINTRLPDNQIGKLVITYRLAASADANNLRSLCTYMERISGEQLAMFAHILMNTGRTVGLIPKLMAMGISQKVAEIRSAT